MMVLLAFIYIKRSHRFMQTYPFYIIYLSFKTTMADAPGEKLTMGSMAKGMFSSATQNFDQISRICEHVCGFHFYAHDQTRQVHAHHLCTRVNEDFRQCIIYDSPKADARLIGIEYIISEKLFDRMYITFMPVNA